LHLVTKNQMSNLCIGNLVYGQPYTNIFLNFHLKSLFENIDGDSFSNSYYLIFTDEASLPILEAHENYQQLKDKFTVRVIKLESPLTYNARYYIQSLQANETTKFALEHNLTLHITTADTYYGKDFIKSALNYLSNGYDSIIHQPMRVTYETAAPHLLNHALSVDELFEVGFSNLHPMLTSANWENPYFSQAPFQMIWSDEKSMCLRGFSLAPTFLIPKDWMLAAAGCIDLAFLPYLKNPYFSNDWSELPMVELGPILTFYPPFSNKRSDIQSVAEWAIRNVPPHLFENLSRYIIYKKINDAVNEELITKSKLISSLLYTYVSALKVEQDILASDQSRSDMKFVMDK